MNNSQEPEGMNFIEHLRELRNCLVHSFIGIALVTCGAIYFAPVIFSFLTQPIRENFSSFEMIGTGPAEAFIIKLKTSLVAGLIISSPYTFFHIWRFISPALYKNEKTTAAIFVFISTLLFLMGGSFCYFIMFPYAFQYFSGEYILLGIQPNIKVDEYLSFVIRLIFVFGIVFELPVICFFMARMRLVSHHWLIKNGRYSVLVSFILAAILTPPDVISQTLLALPLIIIYLICIAIAYLFYPVDKKESNL